MACRSSSRLHSDKSHRAPPDLLPQMPHPMAGFPTPPQPLPAPKRLRPTLPRSPAGSFTALAAAEVELLAANVANDQDAALFEVAAFTGLRLGELRGLRWADVDRDRRLVHVRRSFTRGEEGPPKSGKVRSVPLVDQAARALDNLSHRERFTEDDDRVFVNALGEPFEESAMRRRFYDALDAAELRRICRLSR